MSRTYRATWRMETNYSQKTWTRRHCLHWQLSKCWTKVLQRTHSRRTLERRNSTFRLKATATGQQLSSTGTTSSGQQTSNATPRTRATVKRAPTVGEQQAQAPSKVRLTQEKGNYYIIPGTRDSYYVYTNGSLERWTGLLGEERS